MLYRVGLSVPKSFPASEDGQLAVEGLLIIVHFITCLLCGAAYSLKS
jgi:hypothetical protein